MRIKGYIAFFYGGNPKVLCFEVCKPYHSLVCDPQYQKK